MDSLAQTVKEVVFSYAGGSPIVQTYPLANETLGVYAVTAVNLRRSQHKADIVVMARIEGEHVIVEEDLTDRSLIEALIRAGIPAEQVSRNPAKAVESKR